MQGTTLETLAENGTVQDVIDLLVKFGASRFSDTSALGVTVFRGLGVDYIATGANKDTGPEKAAKLHAVTSYLTDPVAFAEKQKIKPSVEAELRANLEDVTRRLAELAEQVKVIPRLESKIARWSGQRPPGSC